MIHYHKNTETITWTFDIDCNRKDVVESIYSKANDLAANDLTDLVKSSDPSKIQEIARLADTVLYQLRVSCGATLAVVGSISAPDDMLSMTIAGSASENHEKGDYLQILISNRPEVKEDEELTD